MRQLLVRGRAVCPFVLMALMGSGPLPATAGMPVILYVDDDAPEDPGPGDPDVSDPLEDGSERHPFDRIQEALDLATPDTTVHLMPGLWTETMRVARVGCRIEGSGRDSTVVRQPLGTVLHATTLGDDLRSGPPPTLTLTDLALEGAVETYVWYFSPVPPYPEIRLERVRLAGDLGAGGGTQELRLTDVTMTGGDIHLSAISSEHPRLVLYGVEAPGSVISLGMGAEGTCHLIVSESTLSGIDWLGYRLDGGVNIEARNTRFTGTGISSLSAGACGHLLLVEDSLFTNGGIQLQDLSSGDGVCNGSSSRIAVRRSTFDGDGITYSGALWL